MTLRILRTCLRCSVCGWTYRKKKRDPADWLRVFNEGVCPECHPSKPVDDYGPVPTQGWYDKMIKKPFNGIGAKEITVSIDRCHEIKSEHLTFHGAPIVWDKDKPELFGIVPLENIGYTQRLGKLTPKEKT